MRAEQSWSLLDPKPVLLYLAKHDEYIVYWNGVAMTHAQALCMTMETCGIYATPEMKISLLNTYERLYYANAFQTRAWDTVVKESNVYDFQKKCMRDHLKRVCENVDVKDILGWFDYSRARKEEHV